MRREYRAPVDFDPEDFLLNCRGRMLDCRPGKEVGAHVMGILNVTPDSFSDGGLYLDSGDALDRVAEMLGAGAAIIDVGGESSRPAGRVYGEGAESVSMDEEMSRVLPVVEATVDRYPEALISVDTYKPEVARAVLEAGAHLINDVTGLRYTVETAYAVAEAGAALVLMHSLGKPGDPPRHREYVDVVQDVVSSLSASVARAEEAGVEGIVIDPGFGFGKTPEENLRLINQVQSLLSLGHPVMIGVSRKSTIGAFLGSPERPAPIDQRLFGSLGVTAVGVLGGASIVRAHDVRPTVDLLRLIGATIHT